MVLVLKLVVSPDKQEIPPSLFQTQGSFPYSQVPAIDPIHSHLSHFF